MTLQLENDVFTLNFDPDNGTFSILTRDEKLPDLINAQLYLSYKLGKKPVVARLKGWTNLHGMQIWKDADQESERVDLPEQGSTEIMAFMVPADKNGIACRLTFGILQEFPLVIWKAEIIHSGSNPIKVQTIDLLVLDPSQEGEIKWSGGVSQNELGFFSNGWQSWSPSQWYAATDRMNVSNLGPLQLPMIQNHGTPLPRKNGQFSSDFFAVIGDRAARTGFVLGSLSQKNHFTSLFANFKEQTSLRMWANGDDAQLDPEHNMTTDWAVFNPILLDHRDPLDKYLDAVAREYQIRIPQDSPVGWCSWYHFYTHISEPIIRQNLDAIVAQQETLPIQLVQIDDGFESQIGDWFTFKPEFPRGVAPLAAEIKKQGLLPGLWLAPFILHPKAEIVKQNPDWLLRKTNGKPVNAGFVWGTLTTALDLTVPEALDYACQVVKTASAEWGYPYLKLDFLYAAALHGEYGDPTLTRAQVLRKAMEAIREAVGPEVTLLGCGAPFGSMLGLVEAMRIGEDVSGDWVPVFNGIKLFIKNETAMPCARNSIRNILTRANLHQHWWINDPDCLLVRPETHLSLAEVRSLASAIVLTGGSLLVSDDLPKLPKDRMRIAECLLPVIGERAQVLDWFDAAMPAKLRLDQVNETGGWSLLTKFNWKDHAADLTLSASEYQLPECDYWVSEFWGGTTALVKEGREIRFNKVPAHGCVVTAWRRAQTGQAVYLGSDLHISQGIEIAEWKVSGKEINTTLRLPRKASGKIKLFMPGEVKEVKVNDHRVEDKPDADGVLTIPVEIDGFASIVVGLK
jgi:alpha-galactosidase